MGLLIGSPAMVQHGRLHKTSGLAKAHALALNVHAVAITIRGSNYASLRSQMIRAAMSIPANIVEGRSQKSERDFARFLGYALNSSSELEYHLIVARDIKAISMNEYTSLVDQTVEVRKMLRGLIKSLDPPALVPASVE